MFKKIFTFVGERMFPLLILLICGVLAWKNYDTGTYLLGWDSLHSEFNFKDAFYRAFFGVWREDQGLGTVAIHSHMADLPRIIFAWVASFFVPDNLIRYSYVFLCMFLGSLGIYYFLKYILGQEKKDWNARIASFLGSVYYLLNLGTLQHFYVPFEMFTVQFAFLPWLFLYLIKYLKGDGKNSLLIFGLLTLLSTPMAYAATLFYAYLMGLAIFMCGYVLFSDQKVQSLKRSIVAVSVVFLINLFWLLPNIYSVATQSSVVSSSRINTLFSPEAFLRNRNYGEVSDILVYKSFLFGWNAFDFELNGYSSLMKPWIDHLLEDVKITYIGYLCSAIYMLGLLLSLVKRNKIGVSLFGVTLLSLFFLFNENSITTNLFRYLYDNYGIFREGFRMPFTKFSLLFIFSTSFYFSYLLFELFKFLNKHIFGRAISIFIQSVMFAGIILYMLPAFQGNFIGSTVKTKLPSEYKDVFSWFGSNSVGRVAVLPLNSLWGWENHDWRYEGSGFLSFGIKNPLLTRDFDRWSLYNETFYNEASFALYNNDKESFKKVLEKYQVRYLLLDESIINAGGDKELLRLTEIKSMVQELGFSESFKSAFLTVFDTGILVNNISTVPSYVSIDADLNYSKIDIAYQKYGNYVSSEKGIGFPFVNFDKRGPVKIKFDNEYLEFVNTKTKSFVRLPISERKEESFNKENGFADAFNCDLKKSGEVGREQLQTGRKYTAINGGVSCDYFVFEDLKFDTSYTLHIKGQNLKGRSLKIYLYNWETKQVELEELLTEGEFDEYYVIYPKSKDLSETKNGLTGYTLNIETRSFGRIASENIVSKIEFIPFDINLLNNLYTESELNDDVLDSSLKINNIAKFGTAIYKVETAGEGLLKLGQGYEQGWVSYPKLEHLKVDGWSNGWVVDSDLVISNEPLTIYVFFWPQALQWFGFVVSLLTVLVLIVKSSK